MERYPTHQGMPINPRELDIPESNLDPENPYTKNNHHGCYFARSFGEIALFRYFRDLEMNQFVIPMDQHNWIHSHYDQTPLPRPIQAMSALSMAYDLQSEGKPALKYGSANNPHFVLLTAENMADITASYGRHK